MTVQTLRLAGRKFVVLAEEDFRKLSARAKVGEKAGLPLRKLSAEDLDDLAHAIRVLRDPKEKRIPWAKFRRVRNRAANSALPSL